jgi:hypothetical protein
VPFEYPVIISFQFNEQHSFVRLLVPEN